MYTSCTLKVHWGRLKKVLSLSPLALILCAEHVARRIIAASSQPCFFPLSLRILADCYTTSTLTFDLLSLFSCLPISHGGQLGIPSAVTKRKNTFELYKPVNGYRYSRSSVFYKALKDVTFRREKVGRVLNRNGARAVPYSDLIESNLCVCKINFLRRWSKVLEGV